MRLNPIALALAFGVAKVVVTIFTFLTIRAMPWIMAGGRGTVHFFGGFAYGWTTLILFQVVIGFLGGAIAGWLSAVIYNKVIARNAHT
jgi:hypothetical protein